MALTVKRVAKALRSGVPGRYFDEKGLYLVVGGRKAAHWERRYELRHKPHWLGLGSARAFSLEEARAENAAISKLLTKKIDPLAQRRSERTTQTEAAAKQRTFKQAAEEYIARHQAEWSSAQHGKEWHQSLRTYVYPRIGALDVGIVDKRAVLDVLEQAVPARRNWPAGKFWDARTVTASRVRNRIELVLNYAIASEYRPDSAGNPAEWDKLKDLLGAPTKVAPKIHYASVPYAEVPWVFGSLDKHEGISPRALAFLILTAARAGEVVGAKWSEFDLDKNLWTIPASRMKARREHRVPLSSQAINILRELPFEDGNDSVFVGARGKSLSHAAMTRLLARLGRSETAHGFRSSFSDFAHEQTSYSNHVIELSLAHSIGTDVERSYRRTDLFDKRRRLMQEWARFCCTTPSVERESKKKKGGSNVVNIGSLR